MRRKTMRRKTMRRKTMRGSARRSASVRTLAGQVVQYHKQKQYTHTRPSEEEQAAVENPPVSYVQENPTKTEEQAAVEALRQAYTGIDDETVRYLLIMSKEDHYSLHSSLLVKEAETRLESRGVGWVGRAGLEAARGLE